MSRLEPPEWVQAYFGRTFDVYTRLWKFQQQHRQLLDIKYGLKRWQIGEIASKIGQLYYHYYLRTSDTNYLSEAFSFYAAIRARGYYSKMVKEDQGLTYSHRSDLMVKKLRYYARFIVVCLLLKKMKIVRELVRELASLIDDYTSAYEPEDQLEWSLVLGEIRSFIDADNLVNIIDQDSVPVVVSHRLSPANAPPVEKSPSLLGPLLSLQEVIIVGSCCDQLVAPPQVKFSELTLDMFRMLQTLEREPSSIAGETAATASGGSTVMTSELYDASPGAQRAVASGGFPENDDPRFHSAAASSSMSVSSASMRRDNPHKYLLYRPSLPQLLVFLASGFRELPSNGVMLLYISADGCFPLQQTSITPSAAMGPMGGTGTATMVGTMGGVVGGLKHAEEECDELMRNEMRIRGRVPDTLPNGYEHGGAATNNKRDAIMGELSAPLGAGPLPPIGGTKRAAGAIVLREQHCLYPGDLFPFTRKPLFVVVDSDNSYAFENMAVRLFGQPLIVLMSPEETPPVFHDQHHKGSLFTLFLHCPLAAFCFVCHVADIPLSLWERGQAHVSRFTAEASRVLIRSRSIDQAYLALYGDDFLRLLMLRFIFAHVVIKLHRLFKIPGCNYAPRSFPPMPETEVLDHPALKRAVYELATVLEVRSLFTEGEEALAQQSD
ncbi:protein SCAI-like isoform X2 [Varroa jacobsoni]|uniref:protein SCAI-like isoform X2 n=1 Tax=Varroa jacobsoni TaxID=62625 RepID=UPI000BF46C3F|nr:protein SCAI-like isoform X2 [Varroa jacobsoni]XP_022687353.1 protein SCAI-like isoform X2 [Varroa jacobsoni]